MPVLKTMRVLPNPYLMLDHEGRPAGAFPMEPIGGGSAAPGDDYVRYVGAQRKHTVLRHENPQRQQRQLDDYTWEFDPAPVPVEVTQYYCNAVRSKQLLAADLASWKAAGGDPAQFMDPKEALARAKHAAVTHFQREYGADKTPEDFQVWPPAVKHWQAVHEMSAFGSSAAEAKAADDAAKFQAAQAPQPAQKAQKAVTALSTEK